MAPKSKPDHVEVPQQEEQKREYSGSPSEGDPMLRGEVPKLLQQLHVHQVQLEMQNEELRQAQETLAEACEHYTQLYDFSPAGYVTLSPEGTIEEANLRFCAMVGLHRERIVKRPFYDFVETTERDALQRHCQQVLEAGTTQTCQLRFSRPIGSSLVMHVESLRMKSPESSHRKIQMAMLDITNLDRAEQSMKVSEQKLQYTAAKLVTAQDEERRRIARELHDDYCQRLSVMILEISLLIKRNPGGLTDPTNQLQPFKARLVTLLSDLRDFSHGLHPEQTATLTLNDALRACVASFTEQTSISGTFYAPLQPVPVLPAISTCLYRIAQEGLTNIRLHAKAKRASVTLNGLPHAIELVIKDDGQGFVPQAVSGSHHLGLTSMRERVEQVNGTMKITSRPEWGTTIVIQIPLFQADQAGPPTI
jgi:PAS domain S-box-containing protein